MKVRNIAFFGVMASILGVGYANADTPATVIASKAYADTKEATANKKTLGSATWSTITDKTSDVKFPTMAVLNSAVSHAVANVDLSGKVNIDQGDDNKGKVFVTDNSGKQKVYKLGTNLSIDHTNSELKVGTAALGSAAYTASTAYATAAQGTKADSSIQGVKVNNTALTPDSNGTVNVTAAEGSTNGTIAVNGTDVAVHGLGTAAYTASTSYATSAQGTKADSAIQSVKLNGTALTPDSNKAVNISLGDAASLGTEADSVVTSANTTKLPTVGGVQKGIAKQGTTTKSWKTVEQNTEGAGTNLYNAKTAENQDKYVPTVKAVEARITEERGLIDTALAGKQATIADVSAVSSSGKAITSISQTNGRISASTGEITLTGIASSAKATSTSNNLGTASSASDSKLVTEKAVASALGGKVAANNAITASGSTNKFVQYDTKGLVTAGVDAKYKYIDNALYDINTAAAATCSTTNPCVLTYIGSNKFKWTNMDIDSLPVNSETGTN